MLEFEDINIVANALIKKFPDHSIRVFQELDRRSKPVYYVELDGKRYMMPMDAIIKDTIEYRKAFIDNCIKRISLILGIEIEEEPEPEEEVENESTE
jgi:hypothetical protein